jgi:predicted dehydrogenase
VFFTTLYIPRVRRWIAEAAEAGGWATGRIDSFSRVLIDPTSPFHETAWRAGAGALWDTGPHAVAMLLSVLGEVTEVTAVRGRGDLKVLTLNHRTGAISTISLSMDAPGPMPGETAFFGAAGKLALPPSPNWDGEATDAYRVALRALATGEAASFPDTRFGATVTRILAAAEQSIASGRRIMVNRPAA